MARMHWHVALTTVCCALALTAENARAQFAAPDSGAHVRIGRVGESSLQEGSFVSESSDSLSLDPGSGIGVRSFSIRSIQSLDVSTGRHVSTGRVLKGAAAGVGIAILATAAVTVVACAADRSNAGQSGDGGPGCGLVFFVVGAPLTLVGTIVGAWIGIESPVEEWRRVYDRGLTTGLYLGPAPRGRLAIGMTIAFGGPDRSR